MLAQTYQRMKLHKNIYYLQLFFKRSGTVTFNGGHIDLASLCAVFGNHVKYSSNKSKKENHLKYVKLLINKNLHVDFCNHRSLIFFAESS